MGAPLGKNWYDALQTKFTKRFSHGLTANANYTYSKTLALTGTTDPFNRNLGKNLSPYDVPHQLRISAQYEVPRFTLRYLQQQSSQLRFVRLGYGLVSELPERGFGGSAHQFRQPRRSATSSATDRAPRS